MKYLTTTTYRPGNVMNEMDRMLNRFFENGNAPGSRGFAADIAETADGYRIEADLPGFTPAEVDLGVKDNLLTIEAKAPKVAEKKEKDEDNPSWHIRERVEGDRKRSFILPEDVDKSTLEGELKNGRLVVELKKKPEGKPFTVKVRG